MRLFVSVHIAFCRCLVVEMPDVINRTTAAFTAEAIRQVRKTPALPLLPTMFHRITPLDTTRAASSIASRYMKFAESLCDSYTSARAFHGMALPSHAILATTTTHLDRHVSA